MGTKALVGETGIVTAETMAGLNYYVKLNKTGRSVFLSGHELEPANGLDMMLGMVE